MSPTTPAPKPTRNIGTNLDRDLKTIYSSHSTLSSTAVKAPAFGAGFSLDAGTAFVRAGAGTFATRLSTVDHVVVTLDAGHGVPLNLWAVAEPSQNALGSIDIVIWQPTSNVDNTPVLAPGNYSVHWIATGQAETTASKFNQTSFNYQDTGEVK